MRTPDFTPRKMELKRAYANALLGLELSCAEISGCLERMRYGVKVSGDTLSVSVPAYRTDVLHPMDLVEDVAIAYGYHNFTPKDLSYHTRVRADPLEGKAALVREALTGLGFTEVMTLVMTDRQSLFALMDVPEEPVVEAEKPSSQEHSVCRNWILPSLIGVLAKNKTREFPQKVFEVGDVVLASGENRTHVGGVVSHAKTNFSEIKSVVEGLLATLGAACTVGPATHPSFIAGRCAEAGCGFFGEINPSVLANAGLEMPVTAFELRLEDIRPRA